MAILTVAVDADLLRAARIRALQQGTSVDAVIREFLEGYAGSDARSPAVEAFADTAAQVSAGSGGQRWSRDELHDRAALR